jgi:hypothetical protein
MIRVDGAIDLTKAGPAVFGTEAAGSTDSNLDRFRIVGHDALGRAGA